MTPAPASSNTAHLFVYGTLLFDQVVRALTDRTFPTCPANLHGFARHVILRDGHREPYPAIWPQSSGVVPGRVLLDVDERSLMLIDHFESDPPDYERASVVVDCGAGESLRAITYVALPRLRPCLAGEWCMDEFRANALADYVRRVIPQMRRELGR